MNGLVLYDDAMARMLEPFALTRPAGELRAGAELIRRRWEHVRGTRATGFVGAPHLVTFEELDAPRAASGDLAAGTLLVNSRCAPALGQRLGGAKAWRCNGRIAAVQLASPLEVSALADGTRDLESLAGGDADDLLGWWIDDVWDLVRHLGAMLTDDIGVLAEDCTAPPPAQLTVLGEYDAHVASDAYVEPMVIADTTAGPVLVRGGARVAAFTRLVGPCVVGAHAIVAGGRIASSSIGEHARVHGELSTSIFIGHANKAHDGFVGHSVIGRWANLGAGTITSNLKNSYGAVSVWTPTGVRPTGLQFAGSFIGDHAKTGIGTRLTTGSVIGAGANVFGDQMPPKFVPPFAWGDGLPFAEFSLEKFLAVAERVMQRRGVPLEAGARRALREAWSRRGRYSP